MKNFNSRMMFAFVAALVLPLIMSFSAQAEEQSYVVDDMTEAVANNEITQNVILLPFKVVEALGDAAFEK